MFIYKNGENISEIALASKLYTLESEKYNNADLTDKSAVKGEEIIKLQNHVNSLGMTMSEYLDTMGFNMTFIKDAGRNVCLSTLHDESSKGVYELNKSYYAISMTEKGATEKESIYYYSYKAANRYRTKTEKDGLLAVLLTSEKAEQLAKEEAKRLEEEAKRLEEEAKRLEAEKQPYDPMESITGGLTVISSVQENSTLDKVCDFFKNLIPFID